MMISLAGDLLDFSQLKNGKFRKNESIFNLKQCIEEVVLIQQFKAQMLKVDVRCEFVPFLGDDGYEVYSDTHRLQ